MRLLLLALCFYSAVSSASVNRPVVHWRYNNWKIDYPSVCYNHTKNTVVWRDCRSYASVVFRQRCTQFTARSESSAARPNDKRFAKMYCDASVYYYPL